MIKKGKKLLFGKYWKLLSRRGRKEIDQKTKKQRYG